MYTNNAASSTNHNEDQEPITNQETFAQKRLMFQQKIHTNQLLHQRPPSHKSVKPVKLNENSDENSNFNLGNDYPNAEPIYANVPVVQSEEKSKISSKLKYYQDNIYASDNSNQNIDNNSRLSNDNFVSTNRKYYRDNIYSSPNRSDESRQTVTHSKTKEVAAESSKPKYYPDNIYAGSQKTNKNGNETHNTHSKEDQDSIHSSNTNSSDKSSRTVTANSKIKDVSSKSSKPKYYQDNIYGNIQKTNKTGNQSQANSNQDNIYENDASIFHHTSSKEDYINKGCNMRLTSQFEYLINDPVEKNFTAKRAEKAISALLKTREEIEFNNKFEREIGTAGNFDNFDGNVRKSILSLQSNEFLDYDLEEEEEPLRLIMQKEEFKNDRETLCSFETITLNKILTFMDKYKMFSWFQLMKMLQLNILHTMDTSQIKLQNLKFDLILAEWTYLKMMKMFDSHVVSKLVITLRRNEFNKLFGNLDDMIKCSEHFLKDIEDCWQRNPLLPDFFNVVCENIHSHFDCYFIYCGGRPIFEMTLNDLLKNRVFTDILNTIHADPKSQGLHLHGFLLKPYQKIREFPTFIQNAMTTLSTDDLEYDQCEKALNLLENLLDKCAKAEREAKEKILVYELNKKLEFSKSMSRKSLVDLESRRFIHCGEVDLIEMNTSFFKKQKHIVKPVHLFLFNDLLVITKKSSDSKYIVLTYCHRIYIEISKTLLLPDIYESLQQEKMFVLTIQQNHENNNREMLLSFKTYTDKVRWLDALDPYESVMANVRANSNALFQVIVKENYKAKQSDEISLCLKNKIIVYRTYYDGWHFGQRIRDKQFGWFPAKYVLQSYTN